MSFGNIKSLFFFIICGLNKLLTTEKQVKRIFIQIALLSFASLITACMNGSNLTTAMNGNADSAFKSAIITKTDIILDVVGEVTGVTIVNKPFIFRIHNDSNQNYILDSIYALNGDNPPIINPLCNTILPHSSCSIQLTFTDEPTQDIRLVVHVHGEIQKNSQELHQLIRVNAHGNPASGILASADLVKVVSVDNSYNIALPVILQQDFDRLSASNGSIACDKIALNRGTSCTYLLSGEIISDNTLIKVQLDGYRGGRVVASYSENILVRNSQMANLLVSNNINLNANNGASEAEVEIFNSGTAAASIKNLSVEDPLIIKSNSCMPSLAPGLSCIIKVSFASTPAPGTTGFSILAIDYTDLSGKAMQVRTNINYQLAPAAVKIEVYEAGDLNNIPLLANFWIEKIVTFKNTGSVSLNKLALQRSGGVGINYIDPEASQNPCKNDITLAPGSECKIKIRFEPISEISNGNIKISIRGLNASNNKPYQIQHTISYSSVNNPNLLTISKINSIKVLANGTSTAETPFSITNSFPNISVRLDKFSLEPAINKLSVINSNCNNGSTLDSNQPSCSGLIKYDGSNTELLLSSRLSVNYSVMANQYSGKLQSNQFEVEANNKFKAKVIAKVELGKSRPLGFSGNGSQTEPYSFLALKDRDKLALTYTFTNIGEGRAEKFYVSEFNKEMIDTIINNNSCPLSPNASFNLEPGASCQILIELLGNRFLALPAFPHLSIGSLTIPVSYSYQDLAGNITESPPDLKQYVNFLRNWSNEAYTARVEKGPGQGWTVKIVATAIPLAIVNYNNDVYPLTFTPYGQLFSYGAIISPCSISNVMEQSCTASIFFPSSYYIPGDYIFQMNAKGWRIGEVNSLHQTLMVNLPG